MKPHPDNDGRTSLYTKEEYQKIKKRTLTEPWKTSSQDTGDKARGSIELESTDEKTNPQGQRQSQLHVQGRGVRIQSLSVDMGRDSYQDTDQEYDFLQALTTNLNESLAQGLNSLAMIGTWNMHQSRVAKLEIIDDSNNNNNNTDKKNLKNDNEKPLLAETNMKDKNNDTISNVELAKNCTFTETCLNTLQYMVGVVMLCMPYVVAVGGSVELLILIITSVCTLLSALMIDELLNYYNDIDSYSDLVFRLFGVKGQFLCAILTFFELFLYLIATIVLGSDLLYTFDQSSKWIMNNIADLTLEECTIIWSLLMIPIVQVIDLKPLAKLSGVGLFGIIATYVFLVIICIEKQINGTAAIKFSNMFTDFENDFFPSMTKSGYGTGVILSMFCVHTLVPTLKQGMQKPQQFRPIIYVVWISICPAILVVTVFGYVTWGSDSQAPITSNFSGIYGSLVFIVLGFKTASFAASCNLPIVLLIAGFIKQMKCVKSIIGSPNGSQENQNKNIHGHGSEMIMEKEDEEEEEKSLKAKIVLKLIRFGVPTVLLLIAFIISISLKSMAFVSNLAGSVCALSMSIIFPCVMYIKFLLKEKKYDLNDSMQIGMKYVHVVVAISVLVIVSLFAAWNLVSLYFEGP